jgi:hypothetical protein
LALNTILEVFGKSGVGGAGSKGLMHNSGMKVQFALVRDSKC